MTSASYIPSPVRAFERTRLCHEHFLFTPLPQTTSEKFTRLFSPSSQFLGFEPAIHPCHLHRARNHVDSFGPGFSEEAIAVARSPHVDVGCETSTR